MPAFGTLPTIAARSTVTNDRLLVDSEDLQWVASPIFTRPNNTDAYAAGDLVANSTTAASVVPLAFSSAVRLPNGSGYIYGWRLVKSNATNTNGIFRLHVLDALPTVATNGDGDLISGNTTIVGNHLGDLDIIAADFQSYAAGGSVAFGQPKSAQGGRIPFTAANGTSIWGIIAAGAAYVPAALETMQSFLLIGKK